MIKIYGYSDDLVEIEGSNYRYREIDCFEKDVRIRFLDGTVIRVGYGHPQKDGGIWWIEVERKGESESLIDYCNDENAEIYSDIFLIDSEIKSHTLLKHKTNN